MSVASVLLLAGVVAAGSWALISVPDLTASLFGSRLTVSRSLEPREILLRTAFGPSAVPLPEGSPPYEWKIVLPRAFLVSEIGNNGETYRANNKKNNRWYDAPGTFRGDSFFARLHSVATPSLSELRPATLASREEIDASFVGIELANNRLFPRSPVKQYCVRDDDVDQYFKDIAPSISRKKCPGVMPRCSINTIVDGWTVSINVARRLYDESGKICDLARAFLDKYTSRRDAIN